MFRSRPAPVGRRPWSAARRLGRVGAVAVMALGLVAGCSEPGRAPSSRSTSLLAGTPLPSLAPPPGTGVTQYTAIGDSFSAGMGIGGGSWCWRSYQSYPQLLAVDLPGTGLTDRTCSGAEPRHLTEVQEGTFPDAPPQIDGVGPQTDLITYGLGANEHQAFGYLSLQCVRGGPAVAGGEPCAHLLPADFIPQLGADLEARTIANLTALKQRAPRARIIVVGYPQVYPARQACDGLAVAASDLGFMREVNRTWHESLRRAAAASGVDFLNMWALSEGHDMCSQDPWVNPLDGDQSLVDGTPAHPTGAYHRVVAEALAQMVRLPTGPG